LPQIPACVPRPVGHTPGRPKRGRSSKSKPVTKRTNAITIHVVAPAPITLTDAQRLSPATFQFSYSATVGLRYAIQHSGDLAHWTALTTNEAKSGSEIFLDQSATGNPNFYRVGLVPNP
jgi:hypothetical protein